MNTAELAKLRTWDACEEAENWPTLIVGNGFSINIWDRFSYKMLYREADLQDAERHIFDSLETTNFETVLEAAMHANIVAEAYGHNSEEIQGLYQKIQTALFDAVRHVHISDGDVHGDTYQEIAEHLIERDSVFTTNYDLLLYWALMKNDCLKKMTDFFGGSENLVFDLSRYPRSYIHAQLSGTMKLYYLHGALHLWKSRLNGLTGKNRNEEGVSLLDQLRETLANPEDRLPMFVSEANTWEKMNSIRNSDYLTFALSNLRENEGNAVIFGSEMSEKDEHIVKALCAGGKRKIAVSVHESIDLDIRESEKYWTARLHPHEVWLFRASTHPLGSDSFRVEEDDPQEPR
jgi:hypothetical protein